MAAGRPLFPQSVRDPTSAMNLPVDEVRIKLQPQKSAENQEEGAVVRAVMRCWANTHPLGPRLGFRMDSGNPVGPFEYHHQSWQVSQGQKVATALGPESLNEPRVLGRVGCL